MKYQSAKRVVLIAGLLGVGQPTAFAHELSGSLGVASSAIDYYQVHCYDDGTGPNGYLEVSISDIAPVAAPKLSIQVIKDNTATNATDPIDGDAGHSPTLMVNGSADQYYLLTIDKTASGVENYAAEYHCMTNTNQHTGTDIQTITDQ